MSFCWSGTDVIRVLAALLIAWVGLYPISSFSQSRDVSYKKEVHLEIDESRSSPSGYSLEGTVVETVVRISERAAAFSSWQIPEPFYASISNIDVKIGEDDIDRDDIKHVVQDQGDVFVSGMEMFIVSFPRDADVSSGVRIEYDIEYESPAYMPRFELPDLSGDARLIVNIEHAETLTVEPEVITAGDGVTVTTESRSAEDTRVVLRADEARPNRPFELLPSLRAAVRFSVSSPNGLLTPSTPQSFSDWYTRLLPSTGAAPDSSLHKIVEGATSRVDTVRALYDYVRTDVRYLSNLQKEGAIVPRTPKEVLANQYGDCKDKSFFVHSAAKRFGIDVRMALLAASPLPEFEQPHIRSFNHVINAMQVDGEWVFFDGTYERIPFGVTAPNNEDRRALILGDNAVWKNTGRSADPVLHVEVDARMDNLAKGSARLTFTGAMLATALDATDSSSRVARENALSEVVGQWLYRMQLDNFMVIEKADSAVTVSADADLSRFVVASSSRAYVPSAALRVAYPDATDRADDDEPIRLPSQPGIDLTLRLRAADYTVDADSFAVGVPGGESYRAVLSPPTSEASGSNGLDPSTQSTIQYSYRPGPRRVSGSQRADFLSYTRDLLSAKREMFVFSATGTATE